MAIVGVNLPQQRQRGISTLEKVKLAVDIAGGLANIPLSIAKLYQEGKQLETAGAKQASDTALRTREVEAKEAEVGTKKAETRFNQSNTIRDDFIKDDEVKRFSVVNEAYDNLVDSLKQNTSIGDQSAIYFLAKLRDPNAVKEGEIAFTLSGQSKLNQLYQEFQNVSEDKRVPEPRRQQILENAKSIFSNSRHKYEGKVSDYTDRAVRNGLEVADVIVPIKIIAEAEKAERLAKEAFEDQRQGRPAPAAPKSKRAKGYLEGL